MLQDALGLVAEVTTAVSEVDQVCGQEDPSSTDIERLLETLDTLDERLNACQKSLCPVTDEPRKDPYVPSKASDHNPWVTSAWIQASKEINKQQSVFTLLYGCLHMIMSLLVGQCILDCAITPAGHLAFMHGSYRTINEYIKRITKCADELCSTACYLSLISDGPVMKGLAMRAPLYFAKRWYERAGDEERTKWCEQLEITTRRGTPYLTWDTLMPWGPIVMNWL